MSEGAERRLLEMSDEDFKDLVNDDLRRRGEERDNWALGRTLRSPAVVERFHTALLMMAKSVEGQLSAKEAEHDARIRRLKAKLIIAESNAERARQDPDLDPAELHKAEGKPLNLRADIETKSAEYLAERVKTIRFKTGLDIAIVETRGIVNGLRDGMYDSIVARERNFYAERCRRLREAVMAHQKRITEGADEPLDADHELWRVLEGSSA